MALNFSRLDARRNSSKAPARLSTREASHVLSELDKDITSVKFEVEKLVRLAGGRMTSDAQALELREVTRDLAEANPSAGLDLNFWLEATQALIDCGVVQALLEESESRSAYGVSRKLLPNRKVPGKSFKAHDGIILYLLRSDILVQTDSGEDAYGRHRTWTTRSYSENGGTLDAMVAVERYFEHLGSHSAEPKSVPGFEHKPDRVPAGTREDIYADRDDWANRDSYTAEESDQLAAMLVEDISTGSIEVHEALSMLHKLDIDPARRERARERIQRAYIDFDNLMEAGNDDAALRVLAAVWI